MCVIASVCQCLKLCLKLCRQCVRCPCNVCSAHWTASHLAPRRADYEQAFAGVNLKTDIISGALFNISGTLFQGARNHKNLRSSFSSVWPNLLAPLYLTPPGDPSNTVHSFQSTFSTKVLHPSEMAIFILLSTVLFQVCPQVACRGKE